MKKIITLLLLLPTALLQAQRTAHTAVSAFTVSITSVTQTVCSEDFLKIYYRVSTPYNAGNLFRVELSDANGSFATPTVLRTFAATNSGVVSAQALPGVTPGTGYRVRISSTAPVTTSSDNGSDITIKGLTTVNPVPNQFLCAFMPTDPVTFSGTATTYTWTNDNTDLGLPASGSGDIADFISQNSTGLTQTSRIKVVPQASGNLCAGKPMVFVYKVKPFPEITTPLPDQFFCRGQVTAPLSFSSNVAGATFTWENDNTSTGLAASGTGTLPSFTTTNPTNGTITSEIVVAASANGCDGDALLFRYQVGDCRNTPVYNGDAANARQLLSAALTVAPNPVRSTLRIAYTGTAAQLTVSIADASGQPLLPARSFSGNATTLDVSGLLPGSYYVQVSDPRTGTTVQKLIVKL